MEILQQDYRNEYEIRIFHLPRSGSLATGNWLASMFDEPVYFFNRCSYKYSRVDPFRANSDRGTRGGTPIEHIFVPLPRMYRWDEKDIKSVRLKHKNCLMYSYENFDITFTRFLSHNRDYNIGKSRKKFDILILRDVFNWVASVMIYKGYNPLSDYISGSEKRMKDAHEIWAQGYNKVKNRIWKWKAYAMEFLGESNYLENKKICISFNKWFVDEKYRISIANKLGLKYSDLALDYVGALNNGGSSFDRMTYDGRAQEMDCLNRWKVLKDNMFYQEFFKENTEAINLSNRIFRGVTDEIFGREVGM